MKSEDFKDNEYIDGLIAQLKESGTNVVVGCLDSVIDWGRSNSLWPLTFATSCCGIEFMSLGAARYDMARFGFEVARASPRQADFIMVAGTIVHRMAPVLKRLYDQMAEPKYMVATGGCAVSGGPFRNSYHVLKGVDEIIPVDVYPRMSSETRGDVLRTDAVATETESREILRRRKPSGKETERNGRVI